MIEAIGLAAGDIYDILKREGEMPLKKLQEKSQLPMKLFYMALGWLSREDKIEYRHRKNRLVVKIKE
jgi:hypothetical protein